LASLRSPWHVAQRVGRRHWGRSTRCWRILPPIAESTNADSHFTVVWTKLEHISVGERYIELSRYSQSININITVKINLNNRCTWYFTGNNEEEDQSPLRIFKNSVFCVNQKADVIFLKLWIPMPKVVFHTLWFYHS
jgi:hypothetical protein